MTDPTLGRYHFLPWARRGIAASLNTPDGGTLPDRAQVSVQVQLSVQGGAAPNPVLPPPVTVELFGPGDVAGVDPRMVIRTEPRVFTVTFEPNYLCGIEFDSPDFPWLFTPAAANGDQLHPWVTLLVLKPDEFTTPSIAPNPLPVVTVQNAAALTDLSVSWNWAHVQITGDASLEDTLASAPANVISRLLSPRQLAPETSYSAFLVPAFQIGVATGLGQDVSTVTTSDPAWTTDTQVPLPLPFYYRFDFHTSDLGDFESLVRALTPRVLPEGIGQRLLDTANPDPGLPTAGDTMGLDGALESLGTTDTAWDPATKDAFQSALQGWVNQTSASTYDPANPGSDPVVVPPIYGRWHAGVTSVDRTAAGWVNELNLDPRWRSPAGMGTEVVQDESTQLMASAWQQVDGVRAANQMLIQAQLARAATQQLYRQHLVPAPAETLLGFTAPLHSRLRASPQTIAATIRGSRVPSRMVSAAFRAIAARRSSVAALVRGVNAGSLTIVPPPAPPGGLTPIEGVDQPSTTSTPLWLIIALFLAGALVLILALTVGWLAALGVAIVIAVLIASGALPLSQRSAAGPVAFASFTPSAIESVPARPDFAIVAIGTISQNGGSGGTDSPDAAAFRKATGDLFTMYQTLPPQPTALPVLDVPALRTTIVKRIDPLTTIPARMGSLITIGTRLPWKPVDPLNPIMAAPEFPQPMYVPLRDLDERYLLPGVEDILADTVGVLEPNHSFIESYMVGLNHEMARHLLWNGYPTDQRGSYFRQFWDVSAYVPQPGDPTDPAQLREKLKDIPPIHTWPVASALGTHPNQPNLPPDNLVLIVRGELFKRYPNAIVYAGKAKKASDGSRVLDPTDERYPLFRGTLSPDMTFLGFNLTAADARGGTAASPDGFFFVFQEQPSEPRFGLEPTPDVSPVPHWAELAWTNFGNVAMLAPALAPTDTAITSDVNNPEDASNAWGVNSAQTAYILLRLPFRVLMHADLMLPQT